MSPHERARDWTRLCFSTLLGHAPSAVECIPAPQPLDPRHCVAIEFFADAVPLIAWFPDGGFTKSDGPAALPVRAHALPISPDSAPPDTIWVAATGPERRSVFAFSQDCSKSLPDPNAGHVELLLPITPPPLVDVEMLHSLPMPTTVRIREPDRPGALWDATLTATADGLRLRYLGPATDDERAHVALAMHRGALDPTLTTEVRDAPKSPMANQPWAARLLVDPDDPRSWAVALTPVRKNQ